MPVGDRARASAVRTRASGKRAVDTGARREDTGTRAVSAALQRYADRGVFRGLSTSEGRQGRRDFRFLWLTRTPMHVTYDPHRSTLAFARLVPGAASIPRLVSGLKAVVEEHLGLEVPAHRRVDRRRALVKCSVRGGDLSLSFVVRGRHHDYAVQTGLNLVNRMFLHLQAHFPEYLVQHFGFSEE